MVEVEVLGVLHTDIADVIAAEKAVRSTKRLHVALRGVVRICQLGLDMHKNKALAAVLGYAFATRVVVGLFSLP